MRERETTIPFEAFGQYRVSIVHTPDIAASIKKRLMLLKECTVPEDIEECKAVMYPIQGMKESVIFLRKNATLADIVHECWHAIYHMFQYFGAELEDEVVAYHLDYLVEKTYNFVHKKRR